MTTIRIANGSDLDLRNIDLSNITMRDIAFPLAKQCRFNGHCDGFYSIARHSIIGAMIFWHDGHPDMARSFLLHDAHEAFMGDITTPVSRMIGERVDMLKTALDVEIYGRFCVDRHDVSIRDMDARLLWLEWSHLMPGETNPVELPASISIPSDLSRALIVGSSWERDAEWFIETARLMGVQ